MIFNFSLYKSTVYSKLTSCKNLRKLSNFAGCNYFRQNMYEKGHLSLYGVILTCWVFKGKDTGKNIKEQISHHNEKIVPVNNCWLEKHA